MSAPNAMKQPVFAGFSSPAAGFDQPFEMLTACHERVQRSLGLLGRIVEHIDTHGHDAQSRVACADVQRYFDLAGPHHHEDEERHVFPVLRASGRPELEALAERLHADHLRMAEAWVGMRAALAAIERGHWPAGAAFDAVAPFAAAYRTHIEAENTLAYPHAAADIVGAARDAMGKEMASRRQPG